MEWLNAIDTTTWMWIALAAFGGFFVGRFCWRLYKRFLAAYRYRKYQNEVEALYYQKQSKANPTNKNADRFADKTQNAQKNANIEHDGFYKDQKVTGLAKPKGFWTRLVMGEQAQIIKEMLNIAGTEESKGYWQDYVRAQKRAERGIDSGRGR